MREHAFVACRARRRRSPGRRPCPPCPQVPGALRKRIEHACRALLARTANMCPCTHVHGPRAGAPLTAASPPARAGGTRSALRWPTSVYRYAAHVGLHGERAGSRTGACTGRKPRLPFCALLTHVRVSVLLAFRARVPRVARALRGLSRGQSSGLHPCCARWARGALPGREVAARAPSCGWSTPESTILHASFCNLGGSAKLDS